MIIDTHCHVGIHKYEPVEVLLYHMAHSGVDRAVFIQYMGNTDNQYLLACMAAHPGKFAAAMIVEADDDGSQIREWAAQGIGGIRLPAAFRGKGADPLAHWRTAAALQLVVSAPCTPAALLSDEFREVVERFSDLAIIIEHLGGIGVGAQPPYAEFQQVMALARYPNLTIKLPGFGEFCALPHPFAHIPPLVEMTLEAFGPQRIMWGSDWPPVSSREGYDNSLRFPLAYLAQLSPTEQAWIFGETAQQVWWGNR
ncbi:MAG: amidohydrolase [Caldilineaceae bacterium]|nr:amidohydrolase [Caldilineaceae bacterium]